MSNVDGFNYHARNITRKYTWYCRVPGIRWLVEPMHGGWELFYTDGPSWWLFGPDGSETDMCTRKLKDAMLEAIPFIEGEKHGD